METVPVAAGSRSYPIRIGSGLAAGLAAAPEFAGRRVAVVSSPALAKLYPEFLKNFADAGALVLTTSTDGEKAKSAGELATLWEKLAEAKFDRRGVILAFGGGVVGDLAGFLAASYMRGVDFVQAPTTLLAMVDSSVGGKTGVNLAAGKNLVGAFHQPAAVYADTDFLKTLPPREFAAGMAEVVKYGLLADAELFQKLAAHGAFRHDSPALPGIIRRCCEIKAAVVRDDEFETAREGGRALLNLGHTFGHAVENVAGYGEYLHGEAVAIGCALAAKLSRKLGLVGDEVVSAAETLLLANALPVRLLRPLPVAALIDAMRRDKKNRDGRMRFVVLDGIGSAATRDGVSETLVAELWREAGAE